MRLSLGRARRAARRTTLAAGLILVCADLSCGSDSIPSPEGSPFVAELAAVLSEQRWVEPRLSGGTVHGQCFADCPSEELLCEPRCLAGSPTPVRHNRPDPVSLGLETADAESAEKHAEALLALVGPRVRGSRRQEASERAVQMLEQLAAQHPFSAPIRSDLAAAYLVRAQRSDRPPDLLRALEAIESAVRLDPSLAPARFNQALVHEALARRQTAQRAWEVFLTLDAQEPFPGWSREARSHLDVLHATDGSWPETREALLEALGNAQVRELVDPFRSAARRHVEEELLPRWAEALAAEDEEEADRLLAAIRRIAGALAELGGDTLLAESVAAIDAAPPHRLRSLVAGHRAYGAASRSLETFDLTQAMAWFETARRELTRADSPFQAWAVAGLATCRYHAHEYEEALRLLESIRHSAAANADLGRRHANLLGRSAWLVALCESVLRHPLDALHAYRESLARFETTGERDNVTNVHARLADLFRHMGESHLGWRHRYQALRGLDHLRDARRESLILIEAATATLELGLPTTALLLHDEALARAREVPDEPLLTVLLPQHADNCLRAGRPDQALRDLEEALELSWNVATPEVQQAIQARVREVESDLLQNDPLRAIDSLTEALRLLPAEAFPLYRARILLKRARALRVGDRDAEAAADLEESIEALEKEWVEVLARRRRGENEELWPAYFSHRRETFDLMIALLADQRRDDLALSYAERARARELLDLITDLPSKLEEPLHPLSARTVREQLPSGRVLVEYALLEDRLLIWEVRHDRSRLHVQEVGRARMEALAGRIQAFAERDATVDVHGVLEELYGLLLEPFISEVGTEEELVFVPDGPLHGLPFAALRHRETGRFLVQDHVLSVAPSATLYLFSLRRNRELPRGGTLSALLVGNPAFDRQRFPDLEDLPEALVETQRIAAYHPGSVLLPGAGATRPRFLAELGRHDLVHFAGHAVPHPRFPFQSSLVLAPAEGESDVLYAQELLVRDLGRTRLVVFSACSTAGGQPIGSLSVSGLVRPVLGAGVPAVVGTLWDVKSAAATQLLTAFHRHLSEGADAARALRLAQLEMLGGNLAQRSIASWAPFQLIGVASFNDFK